MVGTLFNNMSTIQKITVGDDEAEQRLDRWFRRKFAHINQSNIEKMAIKYNIAYSKYYGNQTTTYFIWTFVPLATTFLTKNLFGVIFCCVVGIAFLPFVFIHLSLCAMVNVEWDKAIKKK